MTIIASLITIAMVWRWMGLSRVFLGHHWLTDVIFAWLLGAAWLALLGHLPPALPHHRAR